MNIYRIVSVLLALAAIFFGSSAAAGEEDQPAVLALTLNETKHGDVIVVLRGRSRCRGAPRHERSRRDPPREALPLYLFDHAAAALHDGRERPHAGRQRSGGAAPGVGHRYAPRRAQRYRGPQRYDRVPQLH